VRFCDIVSVIRRFFTADMTEQRIRIKFCITLKKTAAETHRMLQEAFGDNTMSQSKTFHVTEASRMDERLSTTMGVQDNRRQTQHRKKSKRFARLSLYILGELSAMFLR
jgi:hypothetical protein